MVKIDSLTRFNAGFLSARVGEWIYVVALNWIVLTQSSSPWLLASVQGFATAAAALFLVGYLGAITELSNPRISYAVMGLGCLLSVALFYRSRGRAPVDPQDTV